MATTVRSVVVSALLVLVVHAVRVVALAQQAASSSSSVVTPEAEPAKRITAYTLSPDLYRKAHFLSRVLFASRIFGVLYGIFVLWLVLQRRWSAKFRDWSEAASRHRFVQAPIYTSLLVLTIGVLLLPLDVFDESILKRYGISVQTWGSWIGDWAKLQLLIVVLGTILACVLYAVIRRANRHWWLVFWLASLPIFLFVFFIEPAVIDPMFDRFEPLSDKAPQLIPEIQRVVHRAGLEIPPERMFWMEASNKTVVPNAYVTGFGASKRIVVWDTAIAQETSDGLLTVFGHELGHYVLGHVWKDLAFQFTMAFVVLYVGYRTIGWLLACRGPAWGIRGLDDWASLPALLLLFSLFGSVAAVLGNAYSRYQENQADVFSLEVTHGIVPDPGQAAAASYQRFGEKVFVDPDPNPIDVMLFFGHPTVTSRVHLFATYDPWSKGESPQFVK